MGTWEFHLDFKQSAVGNFMCISRQSATGNFVWASNNRQLGISSGFGAIRNWECTVYGIRAIGCLEFIWISSNRQLGSLFGFWGNRQFEIVYTWILGNREVAFFGISTQSAIQLRI